MANWENRKKQASKIKELVKEEKFGKVEVFDFADCKIVHNKSKAGYEVVFTGKPSKEICNLLSELGFHYHTERKLWYTKSETAAKTVVGWRDEDKNSQPAEVQSEEAEDETEEL